MRGRELSGFPVGNFFSCSVVYTQLLPVTKQLGLRQQHVRKKLIQSEARLSLLLLGLKMQQKFKIVEASEERVRSLGLTGWTGIVQKAMVGSTVTL